MATKETGTEKKSDNRMAYVWVVGFFVFVAVVIITSTWSSVAEKEYLSSLTPDERMALADEAQLEQEARDARMAQALAPFGAVLNIQLPLWLVIVLAITTWVMGRQRRGLW